jgi:2-C-methyl-D-erythritol 4-phosphate cytidylyltransferase
MVIAAAGRGERFGGDKLSERLARATVLEASLGSLERAFPAAPSVVVVRSDRLGFWADLLAESHPRCRVLVGGPRRQDSVRIGVRAVAEDGADVVAIHDAARPLVDPGDVRNVVTALGDAAGAIVSAAVPDTVKRIDGAGLVIETIPRDDLWLAQTPQVFHVRALEEAWGRVDEGFEWSDEAMLLEHLGMTVRGVVARHPNPKLTDPSDLTLLRALESLTR